MIGGIIKQENVFLSPLGILGIEIADDLGHKQNERA